MEVRPPEARDLGVDVRMDPAGEQRIVREVDARHDMRHAERDLFGLSKEVVGIAIQHQFANRDHGHQLLGHELGRVEDIEGERLGLFLCKDLQPELVLGIGTALDGFPEIAAVEVGVRS